MATNKHATIRYHALDRCFSNSGRKYFIEDLIEACNEAIYDFSGIEDGVKRRQVFDDITFMESEQGWSIPLERIKCGRRVYYMYSDKSFSIKNIGINQSEAEQLEETLTILSRFTGLPHFDWIEEMKIRIENTFKLKNNAKAIVGFEHNPYLKGFHFFTDLFNAIKYQQVLNIKYRSYKQDTETDIIISPWYLKQYNNRWFLFGFNKGYQLLSNLALDRIISIKESVEPFIKNDILDFEEYFEDVVGVTINHNAPIENVIIRISNDLWPYINSKPFLDCHVITDTDSHQNHRVRLSNNNCYFCQNRQTYLSIILCCFQTAFVF